MIPYFPAPEISLAMITLSPWGLMVSLGILLGVQVSVREARARGLKPAEIFDRLPLILLAAFLGARLVYTFGYALGDWLENPLGFFYFWDGGWSSAGGFFGAISAGLFLIRKENSRPLRYALIDCLAAGFPLGMAVGRLGCFIIHDHLGILSGSFLAVAFPGVARFDLGLLESLNMFFLVLAVGIFASRSRASPGLLAGLIGLWYALSRFGLDFLRASDVPSPDIRYALLTPAQWLMMPLAVASGYLLIQLWRENFKSELELRTE